MREWISSLAQSPKTIANYVLVLRGILREARLDGRLKIHESDMLDRLGPRKRRTLGDDDSGLQPFSTPEVAQILGADTQKKWLINLAGVMFATGMRSGEAIGLRWEDVDFERGEIRIRRTRVDGKDGPPKTPGSRREIPLFPDARQYLEQQRSCYGRRGCGYVFYDPSTGQPWASTTNINISHWRPLLRRLGIAERRLYQLRHTFASHMLEINAWPPVQIARWMGHSSTEMLFRRYGKFIRSHQAVIPEGFSMLSPSRLSECPVNAQKRA